MTGDGPQTGPRHEPERIYERAADPAEAVNRPLEPKASDEELLDRDEGERPRGEDTHHRLNSRADASDPRSDSDPYRGPTEQDDADRASGTTGSGQGSER